MFSHHNTRHPFLSLQELEAEGKYRQAEHHFIHGEDWKASVHMYRTHLLWDDAYRVNQVIERDY